MPHSPARTVPLSPVKTLPPFWNLIHVTGRRMHQAIINSNVSRHVGQNSAERPKELVILLPKPWPMRFKRIQAVLRKASIPLLMRSQSKWHRHKAAMMRTVCPSLSLIGTLSPCMQRVHLLPIHAMERIMRMDRYRKRVRHIYMPTRVLLRAWVPLILNPLLRRQVQRKNSKTFPIPSTILVRLLIRLATRVLSLPRIWVE